MDVSQLFIAILGGLAIYFVSSDKMNTRFIGCLFGILSQPFWIYSSYKAGQWGILILSIFYTYSWYRGIQNNRPNKL